jgi:phosphoribosylanthranilate isomerase
MRVRVKICGITNPTDAAMAAALGADAIGLNFCSHSIRFIDNDKAVGEILCELTPFVVPVAVFVNEPLSRIQTFAKHHELRIVQRHTDVIEPIPFDFLDWIPAFPVEDEGDLRAIKEFVAEAHPAPEAILVDAHVPGQYGGTGQTAPWHLLADFNPGVPLILAGGLTPENVAEAIRIVKPYAVDVASGVESAPGKKDADKMRRFIDAVRTASA